MGALLDEVAGEQRLLEAWAEVFRRAGNDTTVTRGVASFARDPARRVAALSRQLAGGTWEPGPVSTVRIPKPSGGDRRLGVPSVADRVVERAVLGVIDPLVDPELLPWSFAYRRGLGVRDAVAALVDARDDGYDAVVRLDVADCFDHVARGKVLRRLRVILGDDELCEVLRRVLYRTGRGRSRGVPQGSPLSPLFANVFLDSFDRAMLALGHQVVRYADDIAIPVASVDDAGDVLALATTELGRLGLRSGEDKTATQRFSDGVVFCGEQVTAGTGRRPDRSDHPMEASVYVTTEGSLLRSRNRRLVVEAPGGGSEQDWRLGFDRIRQVTVFGRVGLTTPLIHQLLSRNIDLVFLSGTGRYFGRLAGATGADPFLREAQYRVAADASLSLGLAQRFVRGKIANQRSVLLRSARRSHPAVVTALERLGAARDRVAGTCGISELMGVEGAAAREYFGALGVVLEETGFRVRRRRPPPDPVNSVLSFGYTLLVQEVIGAVEAAGLDPYRGFLHRPKVGRPSLALDLVEEWRPMLVDWLVVRLFSSGRLGVSDFEYPDGDGGMCRLGGDARKVVLSGFERRMLTLFSHVGSGRRVSYRVGLSLQALALASLVREGSVDYRPVAWK